MSFEPTFLGKTNEPSVLLAEKLKAMAPFDAGRVFFGLSGRAFGSQTFDMRPTTMSRSPKERPID